MLIKYEDKIHVRQGSMLTQLRGVYSLEYDDTSHAYYLRKTQPFKLPNKIYGLEQVDKDCRNWLNAFERSSKNIGVSLIGVKGSGKTVTGQYLCNIANKPVIIIPNKIANNEAFFEFITLPELYDSIIFIDEFEKVFSKSEYNELEQDMTSILPLLKLMDGNYQTHFLFVLTSNDELNHLFRNRLGRIRYKKDYDKLTYEVAQEFLQDTLKEHRKADVENILELLDQLGTRTYDILTHYVDELNYCEGTPLEIFNTLNIFYEKSLYAVSVKEITTGTCVRCHSRRLNVYFDYLDLVETADGDLERISCSERSIDMTIQKVERVMTHTYKFIYEDRFEITLSLIHEDYFVFKDRNNEKN